MGAIVTQPLAGHAPCSTTGWGHMRMSVNVIFGTLIVLLGVSLAPQTVERALLQSGSYALLSEVFQ